MIGTFGVSPKTQADYKTTKNMLITDEIRQRSYIF